MSEPIYDHGVQTYSLVPVPYIGDEMAREEHHDYYSRGDWVRTDDHDRVVAVLLGLLEQHTDWRQGVGPVKHACTWTNCSCVCPDCGYQHRSNGDCEHNDIETALREAGIVGGWDE